MDAVKTYRRLLTLGDLVLLGAAAFLTSGIIISVAVPPPVPEISRPEGRQGRTDTVGPERETDAGIVLKRNLFDSRITGAAPPTGEIAEEDMERLPESTLPLELLGTVVQTSGKRSFAILLDKNTKQQEIYFVGDAVGDGAVVGSVVRNRVVLLRGGREEILEKAEVISQETPPGPGRLRPEKAVKTDSSEKSGDAITVRKTGENTFVMDRREVDGMLQDFNQLLTKIRVVPHFADGKPDGFKIFNIRPGSLFAQLGMVNGDIVKRVNGLEISGPEQALQMFTQLRDENQVTVDLERFRKNLTLQYEIR
jgi:general secretion pathway protein C